MYLLENGQVWKTTYGLIELVTQLRQEEKDSFVDEVNY